MYTTRLYGLEIKLSVFIISVAVSGAFLALSPDSYTVGTRVLTTKWIQGWFYCRICLEPSEITDEAYPFPSRNLNLVVQSAHGHITGWRNQRRSLLESTAFLLWLCGVEYTREYTWGACTWKHWLKPASQWSEVLCSYASKALKSRSLRVSSNHKNRPPPLSQCAVTTLLV